MAIEGFDEYTSDLTEDELKFIPLIVRGLQQKIGPTKAIIGQAICDRLNTYNEEKKLAACKMTPARLRKCINHIRRTGTLNFVIGSSVGYYVSRDPGVVSKEIKSLVQRATAIQAVADAIQEHLNVMLTGSQQKMKL